MTQLAGSGQPDSVTAVLPEPDASPTAVVSNPADAAAVGARAEPGARLGPARSAEPDFSEVLAAARQGSHWAMEVIYRQLHPAVLGFCRARVPDEAEDVASEVFIAVAKGLGRFEGDARRFRSWVFTIAYRTVGARRRQRHRRPEVVADLGQLEGLWLGNAEDEALAGLDTRSALRLISELPAAQAEVLALRLVADLSVEEVATVVGRRPGAVRALQLRGLRGLGRKILPDEP